MDYLEYKGYKGSVEYSKADNCLFGKVLGMSKDLILYEGSTIDELRADFEAGIESYLAGCLADGVEPRKPYSGTLNIRISPEIHSSWNNYQWIYKTGFGEAIAINTLISLLETYLGVIPFGFTPF